MIIGIPIQSFILTLLLPAIVIGVMFYYCGKIRDETDNDED